MNDDRPTKPENDAPDEPMPAEETARWFAGLVGPVIDDVVRKRLDERIAVTETEQSAIRHLCAEAIDLHNATTARLSRRISILEVTRLAPILAAVALSLAAFGIVAVRGDVALAAPACSAGGARP